MILSLCIFILCGIFFISPPLQIVRSFIQILSCLFIIWNNCFWSKICYPMKLIYYVENIKSTNFALGTNTKSTNLWIHELVIFNQTTKIDAHEEKYFHSICNIIYFHQFANAYYLNKYHFYPQTSRK